MSDLTDTHCHPWSTAFNADRAQVLTRAHAAGVTTLVVVGCDPASNRASLELARENSRYWATAGFHPHDAKDITGADWDELERAAGVPEVVALGEMGLDFFRNISPPDVQRAVFERQLELCTAFDLPAVIHSREAAMETWEMVEGWARQRRRAGSSAPFGVMHCYAYDAMMAERYIGAGLMISIPGTVTYPNNSRGREVAAVVSEHALVLETDCPYLTPQSRRGKRNEPALLRETAEQVATLRGMTFEQLASVTTANARRLFRIDAAAARRAAQRPQITREGA